MIKEIWKNIPGYEEIYKLSNYGRIKNISRNSKILNLNKTPNGYLAIELYKKGIPQRFFIHRLAYEIFIGKISENYIVHHIDKNPCNNEIENLISMTWSEHNKIHSHKPWNKGLLGYSSGSRNSEQYATRRKKIKCLETGVIYNSVTDASLAINRKINTVSMTLANKNRTAAGYHFEYA